MAITKVINDAVDLNQTSDYSGLRLPVGTTGNVAESFTTDYLVVGGGGSGSLQGAGGAGGLRTSYNNSTTTTNTLSFPSGKTAIATYMLDGNATDVSGNYNGTETNITYNTGQYGGAAVFNGSSSNISISGSIINSLTSITYSVWVYYRGDAGGQSYAHIVGGGGTSIATGNAISLAVQNSNDYLYSYSPSATSFSTTALPRNTWTHLALTNDGSTTTIYMNGNSVHTASQSLSTSSSGNAFRIGEYFYNGNYHFYGSIDQVRIYNSALSSTDVTNIYNNEVQANSGGGTAAEPSLTLSAGTAYDVTIGAGGIDTYTSGGSSESGANSIFSTITSTGGGGAGATSGGAAAASGKNGGSGGGAGSNTGGSPGSGTLGQGYIGGTALFYGGSYAGGGGGGALGSGGNTTSNTVAGNGGAQLNLAITGNSVGYAGGGGGSLYGTGTVGTNDSSAGAAAPSGSSSANGESAPFNLGGGGGGANHITGTTNITGGAGGSGVVILRYPTASISSFTTTGTLNTPSTTDTIADTAYPVANTAYYKLDNSAIDLSGSTGKFDQAGVFNGSSSGINLPSSLNTSVIDATGAFSISMWINANDISTIQYLFCSNTSNNVDLGINTNNQGVGKIVWTIYNTSYSYLISTTTITTNTWYNIIVTYNNGLSELFINGASQGTITKTLLESSIEPTLGYRNTGGSVRFNGSIDQVRIYDTALSSTDVTALYNETVSTTGQLNFPSGQTAIATYELNGNANGILTTTDLSTVNYPAGAGCIALYEMNGTADDTSGVYNGTPSNIDYNFGAFGQAANLTATNGSIEIPGLTPSQFSATNVSVSVWVNMTSLVASGKGIYLFNVGSGSFQIQVTSSGVNFYKYNGTNYGASYSTPLNLNQWYHIAATASTTAGMKLYLNGTEVASNSFTGTIALNYNDIGWGYYNDYADRRGFSGLIDQGRIFNTTLTQAQVTTLARGIGTSYSGADTNVLYAYNGTPTNVTYGNGRFNEAANFNGSSSKIVLPNSSLGITDASNFSFSCWFNTNSSTQDNQGIIWTNGSNAGARFGVGINSTSQGGDTSVYFGVGTSSFTYINSGTSAFTANTWVHVVCVKSSITGMSLYVNNVLKATNTGATGAASTTATGDNRIGGYKTTAESSWFNGSIDQVRIYGAALTSSQVTELYNEHYQTKFTDGSDTAIVFTQGTGTVTFSGVDPAPPQGALRANTSYSEDGSGSVIEHYNGTGWKYFDAIKYCTTNTLNFPSGAGCIASYNLNNNVDDIGNTYNGVNSNVTFTASGKFGAAAVFNGSSSYISIPQGSLPVGASARTVSMWINTTQTTLAELYGYGIDGNNLYYAVNINAAAGKIGTAFYANDHNFTASVIDGAWHHIVSVYNGNTVEMYVDGQSVGNATAGAVNTSAAGSPKIGKYNYTGSIDQVRIFNDSLTSDEVTQLYNNEIACS